MTVTELFPNIIPPDGLTSVEVARRSGITYRMLDHWLRCGYVACAHNPHSGAGIPRLWTRAEAAHVRRMADLARAGFTVDRAADLARELAERGTARVAYAYVLHEADA